MYARVNIKVTSEESLLFKLVDTIYSDDLLNSAHKGTP